MGHGNSYPGVEEYAVRSVQCTARWMVGRAGFTHVDVEDLEQELMSHLLPRLARYDAARASRRTYITRVVRNRAVSLLAAQNTVARTATREHVSLDAIQEADVPEDDAGATRVDLRLDVQVVLASLPEDLRQLCERLRVETLSAVARSLGVPRTTLYRQIGVLRSRFAQSGLVDPGSRARRPHRGGGR